MFMREAIYIVGALRSTFLPPQPIIVALDRGH